MRRQSLVVIGIGSLLATGSIVVAAAPPQPAPATTGSVSGKLVAAGASSPLVVYIETASVPVTPRSEKWNAPLAKWTMARPPPCSR